MKKRAIVLIGMFVCTLFVFTTPLSAAPDIFGSTSGSSLQDLFDNLGMGGQGQGDTGGQGNPGGGNGNHSFLDVLGVKGIQKGLITVDKNIFYPADTLEVGVVMPQEIAAFWDGEAEAYIMIRLSDGSLISPVQVTVSELSADQPKTIVTLDLSETPLTEGEYQIALVLVTTGGDAAELTDWHDGFRGLIGATSFKVKEECGTDDADCDGLTEASDLAADAASVTVVKHEMTIVTISGGSGSYTASTGDATIATANLLGQYAIVAGVEVGDTTITVTDTDGNTVEFTVSVVTQD